MRLHLLATVSVGLFSAACSSPYENRNISAATGSGIYASSNQACVDYGFVPNTWAYSRCVTAEQQARLNYRATPGYAPSLVVADSRNACHSYGLTAGTAPYDRCVARETEARAYRDSAAAPAYRVDAQGYRVDANGYRLAGQPAPAYYPAATVTRDEFGNRYDSQGNRINASGQIIPMRESRY
ncbi:MAG: hypothetical protein EPO55_09830 [Reyranella sp.]|uniref:hypothetical protein n=1 Tax=Reyranella sp. TaxID=1929291 RepID=UPI00120A7B52|nr:hypothetical protein [Reyranella sp.]TAJ40033.1 MAG: hypothetical protein EPO55_09830 [Reyranella sp.]